MAQRGHVTILTSLLFLGAGCGLVWWALSHQTADLDAQFSSGSGEHADPLQARSAPFDPPPPPHQTTLAPPLMELRQLYLVDLMECGKTFALLRAQVEVRVPARSPPYRQRPAPDSDPLEVAGSEMEVVGRQLLDCFFIDLDKRYHQKVALEDQYRLVASTRRVPFKRMMDAIVECRNLTWSSLPALLQQSASDPEQVPRGHAGDLLVRNPTRAPSRAQGSTREPILSAILASLARGPINGTSSSLEVNTAATPTLPPPELGADDREEGRKGLMSLGLSMVSGIVPNTLWCGLGDLASNYSELGTESKVDSCCRSHDHCPIRIKPFASDYGLVNWSVSTRSHCECDLDFNECLQQLNSTFSNVIRVLYFRFIGVQCIDVEARQQQQQQQPQQQPQSTLPASSLNI